MMVAMANVWFKEDLCDQAFIDKYVDTVGLEKWKDYVLGISDGTDKTPEWAETICGVPTETIAAFARLYAKSKPVNLNVALSLGRQFYGENGSRASMYLQALTGNTMIPGGNAVAESGLWWGSSGGPMPYVNWHTTLGSYEPPVLLAPGVESELTSRPRAAPGSVDRPGGDCLGRRELLRGLHQQRGSL
jgi:anaerobic selenocysteine-containing dehydrogenase